MLGLTKNCNPTFVLGRWHLDCDLEKLILSDKPSISCYT